MLDPFPYLRAVFSTEALLNSLLVVHFGLSGASLQSSSSTAAHIPVSRPEGALSLPQKFLDLPVHLGLQVGEHPDEPVDYGSVNTVLDVAEFWRGTSSQKISQSELLKQSRSCQEAPAGQDFAVHVVGGCLCLYRYV